MFEALSIVLFAGVMYFCLVVAPSVVEFVRNNDGIKNFETSKVSE